MNKPITVAIAGCGGRGWDTYAQTIVRLLSDRMKVVAAADPREDHIELMRKTCGLTDEMCFHTVEEMFERGKIADALFICTPDRTHYSIAIRALNMGYHLLLEKPIATTVEECQEIARLAEEKHLYVVVCHVMRYMTFCRELKRVLNTRVIGDLMCITGAENVSYWHQAHSFVRGNWANSDTTTPMILQKCCHDMDFFLWLTGKHCKSVSSIGHLTHFKPENAPANGPDRCTDDCPIAATCPYNAVNFYITHVRNGHTNWPVNFVHPHPTEENIMESLRTGPYGRCVYRCNNNVVDHQIVNLEMEDELTIQFLMTGFTANSGRTMRLMGTLGEIQANFAKNTIEILPFRGTPEIIDVTKITSDFSGHGGGDRHLLEDFATLLETDTCASDSISLINISIESHIIALAAEESRLNHGQVVTLR